MNTATSKIFWGYFQNTSWFTQWKKIKYYLVKFANDLGLEVKQDNLYNVIIYKPASKGYENHPAIILQSHIDMVCEKNGDCNFDFEKDSLQFTLKMVL